MSRVECRGWSVQCGVWSAAPATQNDDKDCQNAAPATKIATHLVKTTQAYCACHTKRLSTRYQTGCIMSQSAAPATQNNITTCLETFEKERFCSFPHRHGEATGKPETIFILCSFKIDVFLRVFLGTTSKFATSKSMFRAKLPSIFITSHKMPRRPRNLHLVAT